MIVSEAIILGIAFQVFKGHPELNCDKLLSNRNYED